MILLMKKNSVRSGLSSGCAFSACLADRRASPASQDSAFAGFLECGTAIFQAG
jgi:hypothetical protein